ncbi:hypothetical protein AC1031_013362 [Aphanomyces cochlioides]|nr:hypothetical protein AC1031_013362 [Aphanomyces cochlioides]
MSYRMIEARFQMLDEVVAQMEKSRGRTRLDASVGLRDAVRVHPTHVASWNKPKPRLMSPRLANSHSSSSRALLLEVNQTTHDPSIHISKRRITLQTRQTHELGALVIKPPPAFHNWGHDQNDECTRDPKEIQVHDVVDATWKRIDQAIADQTNMTVSKPVMVLNSLMFTEIKTNVDARAASPVGWKSTSLVKSRKIRAQSTSCIPGFAYL